MGMQKKSKSHSNKTFHFRNVALRRSQLRFQAKQLSFCLTKDTGLWTWAHWLPGHFWCDTSCDRCFSPCPFSSSHFPICHTCIFLSTLTYFNSPYFICNSSFTLHGNSARLFWCVHIATTELIIQAHRTENLEDKWFSHGRLYPGSLAARSEETWLSSK